MEELHQLQKIFILESFRVICLKMSQSILADNSDDLEHFDRLDTLIPSKQVISLVHKLLLEFKNSNICIVYNNGGKEISFIWDSHYEYLLSFVELSIAKNHGAVELPTTKKEVH